MTIAAILFDMDDLLINSAAIHFAANDMALAAFGKTSAEVSPHLTQKFYGMRIREIMELLIHHFQLKVGLNEFTAARNRHFMGLVAKGVGPMPGMDAILKNAKRWKMKTALATSGLKEYADVILKQFQLENYFDTIVTGSDVKNPKPAPDVFLSAAKKLGLEPRECLVLEDSTHGITAAKRAGMKAIGVENSMMPAFQDLSMADAVVTRLDKITLELIQKL
ncbi:MAG: HAD family phosphatase [Deltaproteobacteria bacterium]|nr:HAD family phosphatase [Deltaproteobacteria bacterium]